MGADPDVVTAPPTWIVGASAVGASHARQETPCQDAFAERTFEDGFAIAVSDGMGSAAAAALGARIAVDAAVIDADDAETMARAARAALEAHAAEAGVAIGDLACTFLAICLRDGHATIAHVGDGAIVGLDPSGNLRLLSAPENGEYVNETTPLTSDRWREALRLGHLDEACTVYAAFTDGLAHAALTAAGEPHPGFWNPLVAALRRIEDVGSATAALQALLAGPKLAEHSDDDKTLVLAWP